MKKLVSLVIALTFAIALCACSSAKNVPSFEAIQTYTEEDFEMYLNRVKRDALIKEWGEPYETSLDKNADTWLINETRTVTIIYDKNDRVKDAEINNIENSSEATVVHVIEENSNTEDSSYRVGAILPGTDFSSISQMLEDKITQEWKTHDGMTKEALMLSSRVWGLVYFETDTWNEFEEAIGLTVNNPLESLGWLNKTGSIGMESADPSTPIKHIEVTADTVIERKLNRISVTSGYNTESARISLTATLLASAETYTTGSVYNGYATYEQNTAMTGSGISVLIVITDGTNNTGYYNGDYYDPTVYWVKDNVFYALHVIGDSVDKDDIQETLDRILAEI